MAWSEQMPFENPALAAAQKKCEAAEDELCRLALLAKSRTKKYRDDAMKRLPEAANAALRASIELDRLS